MRKNTKNKDWKPVKLEGTIFSNDISGLIGFEELTEYDNNIFDKKAVKRKVKHSKSEILKNKKIKLDDKKLQGKKSNLNKPGAFVRNPNFCKKNVRKTQKTQSKSNLSNKKVIPEIGCVQKPEEQENCLIKDLDAWNFISLHESLLQGIANLGFTKPTAIQELTLPPALYGRRDILGAAETGSGKTLAFGLPILNGILKLKEQNCINNEDKINEENIESENENSVENNDRIFAEPNFDDNEIVNDDTGAKCVKALNNVQFDEPENNYLKPLFALILTPTRELAIQIKNHLTAVAKYTDIKIAVVLGGLTAEKQKRILSKGPEIVVATPGRLWELIQEGNPHLSQVDNIKYFAIDETDRMLEKFHFQELQQLLERINTDENKRKQRQNFVFSATLAMVHDLPRYLYKKKTKNKIHKLTPAEKLQNIIYMLGISNPKVVDITENSGTAKSLIECRINCALEEKDFYVYYFLQRHPGRTLIFCNSIDCVRRLANLLTLLGCYSLPLHANMQQKQRLKNLERFRDNPCGILVATDVAARGLDIPNIKHVLHYQTPRTSENYVHRSGRTARVSQEGITVLLIEPKEVINYIKLCTTLGRTEDLPSFPILENYLAAVKQRVSLARKLEVLELQFKKSNAKVGWFQKSAKEMDIVLDEDEFSLETDSEEIAKRKRQIAAARQELKHLLSKPIFPKGFSVNYPTSSGLVDIPLVQGDQSVQKAVDVMKTHLENNSKKEKYRVKKIVRKSDVIKEKKQIKQKKKDAKRKKNKSVTARQ